MARTLAVLPKGARITDYISLGVIASAIPASAVRAVLARTNKAGARQRALPAPVVVYYVIALALYMPFLLPRGAALPAGRAPVAGRFVRGGGGGDRLGDLAGADAAGPGALARVAR